MNDLLLVAEDPSIVLNALSHRLRSLMHHNIWRRLMLTCIKTLRHLNIACLLHGLRVWLIRRRSVVSVGRLCRLTDFLHELLVLDDLLLNPLVLHLVVICALNQQFDALLLRCCVASLLSVSCFWEVVNRTRESRSDANASRLVVNVGLRWLKVSVRLLGWVTLSRPTRSASFTDEIRLNNWISLDPIIKHVGLLGNESLIFLKLFIQPAIQVIFVSHYLTEFSL